MLDLERELHAALVDGNSSRSTARSAGRERERTRRTIGAQRRRLRLLQDAVVQLLEETTRLELLGEALDVGLVGEEQEVYARQHAARRVQRMVESLAGALHGDGAASTAPDRRGARDDQGADALVRAAAHIVASVHRSATALHAQRERLMRAQRGARTAAMASLEVVQRDLDRERAKREEAERRVVESTAAAEALQEQVQSLREKLDRKKLGHLERLQRNAAAVESLCVRLLAGVQRHFGYCPAPLRQMCEATAPRIAARLSVELDGRAGVDGEAARATAAAAARSASAPRATTTGTPERRGRGMVTETDARPAASLAAADVGVLPVDVRAAAAATH